MRCIFCEGETKVTDKRDSQGETRRRRECLKCKKRFTTYERVEEPNFIVIKKDKSREPFSREKLRMGIEKACEKRPIETEKIDSMVSEIERKIRNKIKGKEVESSVIGELVMKELKKVDKVAYIRFASVYREFKDITDFKREIKEVE
ncbi:transcriptional regulator NrdR [Candidatus Pacearchaeota archaeon RBG_13_36_9]|nr:MAG: transcriptional regulator NrdR [Candidatus Pacearchaeota archaeon RBG_13_36_9]